MSPFEIVVDNTREQIVLSVTVGKPDKITRSERLLKVINKGSYNPVDENYISVRGELLATYYCTKGAYGYSISPSIGSNCYRRILDCQMACIADYCKRNNMTPMHRLGMKGE